MEPSTYTSSYEQPRRNLKPFILAGILVLVVVIGGSALWYAATHGRVVTTNSANGGGYTLQKSGDEQAVEESIVSNGKTTVRSGKYILRYNDGESESLKYIEVPTFLKSVMANIQDVGQRFTERVAVATLNSLVQTPEGIVSLDNTNNYGSIFRHQAGDPTGFGVIVDNIPLSGRDNFVHNNTYTDFTLPTDEQKVTLQRYDFMTGKMEEMPKLYTYTNTTSLIRSTTAQNNLYGVAYAEKDSVSLDVYDGNKVIHQIKNLKNIAAGEEGRRAISISDKYLATGEGSDYSIEADTTPNEEEFGSADTKNYVVKIYDITKTNKVLKSIKLGKTTSIGSLQINNDGSYLSVIDGQKLRIFNVQNGEEVFTYAASSITDPQWVSGAQLIFATVEGGLFRVDAAEKSAVALFVPKNLNLSSFDLYNNKVYFTAYSTSSASKQTSVPDGYVLHLDQEAKDNNQLVRNTPLENSQVRITSLNNIIYAVSNNANFGGDAGFREITPDQLFKNRVSALLKLKLVDPGQYKLIYGNHF
jgi:hypothetical protein